MHELTTTSHHTIVADVHAPGGTVRVTVTRSLFNTASISSRSGWSAATPVDNAARNAFHVRPMCRLSGLPFRALCPPM